MGIRDFLDRLRSKKAKVQEFEENVKIQEQHFEKRKSANERELERFQEEERQRQIAEDLKKFREYRRDQYNYGNQITKVPNMFKGGKAQMMQNNQRLLKGKADMFHKGDMFFK